MILAYTIFTATWALGMSLAAAEANDNIETRKLLK